MKEIRRIYVAQKKKEVRNHFTLVGMAMALMSALATQPPPQLPKDPATEAPAAAGRNLPLPIPPML